jgi:hypothetical protein
MARVALILIAACLAGCTTAREPFPGQDPAQVWRALVAVAESPSYDDPDPARRWTVRQNSVWIDEGTDRIEIYRELVRILHEPRKTPRRDERTWRFRVILDRSTSPPTAEFIGRDLAVPSHVWNEAVLYFDDVWGILGGREQN